MGSEEIIFFPYDSLRNDFNLIILVARNNYRYEIAKKSTKKRDLYFLCKIIITV